MTARVLGLDYGDARIGVAISDPLGWTSRGLRTISRKNPIDLSACIIQIADIVKEHRIETIVLGYPRNMDNTEGGSCRKVLAFKNKLEAALPDVAIELFDERLSTSRALRIFGEVALPGSRRKENIDKMAASIILQDYLDLRTKQAQDDANEEKSMEFNEKEFDENFEAGFDFDEGELETIIMTDEDGNEIEFMVIDEFMHNMTNYLIMVKAEDADEDEAEAAIFKQVSAGEEEYVYEEINEEEYNDLEDMLKTRMAEFDIDIQ
ncbi:MAG: Holliday junction resolvase RuvX [Clostridiales bacterium]|jgi:putative Holliday junction resolvase|nr:Holliday junction resolvase RuvX [Clostridiales bacterium]